MNVLKTINTLALSIPIFFVILGIFDNNYFLTAIVSTMATGFLQIIIGIYFWYKNPNSIHIKVYFFLTLLFFILVNTKIQNDWYWSIPAFLCLYLTILIYTKK